MKKISFILILVFGFASFTFAQYEKGQKDLNIGVGFGSGFIAGKASIPPISLSFDVGINDQISIGGYFGYTSSKLDAVFYSWNYTYMIVGARGAYHLDLVDNIDTYGGALLGYNIASIKEDGSSNLPLPTVGGLAYAGFVGARYHFGESFGLFAELGYGISLLNVGLTLKF